MTRNAVAGWVWVSGLLLACSGRFEVGANDMALRGEAGAPSADGPTFGGTAQDAAVPIGQVGGSFAAGSASIGGAATGSGQGMSTTDGDVRSSDCGVPLGQPAALMDPIVSYRLQWWDRLAQLVWGEVREAPMDLPSSIDYAQAGAIVDAAIDRAIAETGGIPGANGFVRWWLGLDDRYDGAALSIDWSKPLAVPSPATTILLTNVYDATRMGAFAEPAFLQTYPTISRRGYVMVESIFGMAVPPEPSGTPVFEPPAGMTRRQAIEQSVNAPQCQGCHRLFDPLGGALENYGEMGTFTLTDAGQPVDASGTLIGLGTDPISFTSYADLAPQLHERCDVNLKLADQFLSYALVLSNVPETNIDARGEDRDRMKQSFIRGGRTYRSLIKAFALSPAGRDFWTGIR